MKQFLIKIFGFLGSILLWFGLGALAFIIYVLKMLGIKKYLFNQKHGDKKKKDPFHNSRQHPLNDPDAPRG